MSKSFGLAGLRIGWVASSNRGLLERLNAFKDYTSICNSAPSEFLATIALKHKEVLLNRNRSLAMRNLALLKDFFDRHQELFQCVIPKAGCIAFPRLLGGTNARAFSEKLLEETGTLLLPSALYDYSDAHFRIGFGRSDFPAGLAKLEGFVTK